MACYEGFGNMADGRPFWMADFDGDGQDEVLFYYPGDDNWWLGKAVNGTLSWRLVGNTAGFGHAINDGRPFWTGDFRGTGRAEVLFYYPGDDNWWIGSFDGTNLTWSLAGNTAGFGHGINDGRPFWIGRFVQADRDSVLFYYPGDDNWWVGTFIGNSLTWAFAGNTAGFGHGINDGRPFWIGRFVYAGQDSVLFYYPGDDNWWLGTWSGGQLAWSFAGNTSGFGHGISDGRPFWVGRFLQAGRSGVLFYFPGDGNWWNGIHSGPGGQIAWSLLGNTGAPYDAWLNINLILVGAESFTQTDLTRVLDSMQIMRGIYRRVGIVIRDVEWYEITNAQAGAAAVIDSGAEADDLTDDWTVPNEAVDVFVVRQMNGADGWSAVDGSCNKDAKGMTGSVVSLNGTTANSGNTFAHEVGHYLGLDHIADVGNFIGGDGGSDSWTGIYDWQGDRMKRHCFVNRCA